MIVERFIERVVRIAEIELDAEDARAHVAGITAPDERVLDVSVAEVNARKRADIPLRACLNRRP